MANTAKNAILRAKLAGVLTDLMPKTITDNVYVNDTTTLTAYLATLATNANLEALQNAVNALGALAQKDKVSQADLDEALATLIGNKAEASALTEEINRAKAAEKANADDIDALEGRMDTAEGKITTLVGTDTGKSVRTIANEELAAQLIGDNAKDSLDTLEEIAAWIQNHPDDASAMNAAITALQAQLNGIAAGDGTVKKYVDDAIAALKIGDYAKAADLTTLAGRVTTSEGKITALEESVAGLGDMAAKDVVSEADLDTALAEKVNASAQANHSHTNKEELDKIANGDKSKWDTAAGKAHEHANKTVLDGISAEKVTAWDGKSKIFYSAEEPADLAEGDLWVALVD